MPDNDQSHILDWVDGLEGDEDKMRYVRISLVLNRASAKHNDEIISYFVLPSDLRR